jgi:hypothetical protein
MDFAVGGKIDTELYSAAIGALSSTANAGVGAAMGTSPNKDKAKPQARRVLPSLPEPSLPEPGLPDRFRFSVSLICSHTSNQKNLATKTTLQPKQPLRKLSRQFDDAKAGCMVEHGNLRHVP